MKARLVILVIVVVFILAAIGLTVAAWVMRPRLLEVYPHPGEQNVSAVAPIRLIFSRNMQASSVLERLSIEPSVRGGFSWDDHTLTFSPTDSWPGGQEIKLSLATGARAKSWLAFPLGSQSWSFFTSQSSLAYLWPAEGPAEIYLLNPETGDVHQMTSGMAVMEYTVSSDGFMVYFSASNSEGGSDLYVYERLKAAITESIYRPRLLLDCGLAQCRSPAVSFGGTSLAYEYLPSTNSGGLAPASIWLLDLETLSSSQIGQAGHETVQPAWSSKGLLAYYDRSNSCYELYDIQNQARLQVPNQTGQPGTWSPDGEFYLAPEIYYTSSAGQGETGTSHLLKYAAQTGVSEDLSQLVDVEDVEGIFAPDGRSIAFERKFLDSNQWTLGRQIWLMTPDGSGAHPITDAPDYNHYDLAWSLDSLKIAYVRFNQAKLSTPPELWIVDADGSNRIELVVGGYAPQWTP